MDSLFYAIQKAHLKFPKDKWASISPEAINLVSQFLFWPVFLFWKIISLSADEKVSFNLDLDLVLNIRNIKKLECSIYFSIFVLPMLIISRFDLNGY